MLPIHTPDYLPLSGSDMGVVDPFEITERVASLAPDELLSDSAISTITWFLDQSGRQSDLTVANAAADRVRHHIWKAMGSQPSKDPVHLAATILFEGALYNSSLKAGLLIRSHIMDLHQQVTPGEPQLLAMEYSNSLELTQHSTGLPTTPGLAVGLTASSSPGRRKVFSIGIDETELNVDLTDATNCWLEGEELAAESKTLSLASGKQKATRYLGGRLSRIGGELTYLARRRNEYAELTQAQKEMLPRTLGTLALRLKPLLYSAHRLSIAPNAMGLTDKQWERLHRVAESYAQHSRHSRASS